MIAAHRREHSSALRRGLRPALALAVALSGIVAPGASLSAQLNDTPPAPVATTSTTQPVATTTSTTAPHGSTTTTVAMATTTSTTISPALIALSKSVKRTRPSNTSALLAALAPLQHLGYTAQQAAVVGMGQFPVGGPASYSDDWLELRPGPPAKLHYGIDVVAASGTLLRSPVDGILRYDTTDPTGYGLAALVTAPDKTYYLMGHLSAAVTGLASGSAVKQGQVIGFVGQSGDATGPHTHLEIHPLGGAGVDAKPILDRYLTDALAAAPALVHALQAASVTTTAVPAPVPAPLALSPVPPNGRGVLARSNRRASRASVTAPALVAVVALFVAGALATKRFAWASDQEPASAGGGAPVD